MNPDSFRFDFDGWQVEPWPELDLKWDWEPCVFQWEDLVIDWPSIDWPVIDWEAVDWPDLRGDFWDPPDPEKP